MAIGIEHVGTSDADVLGRSRQLAASLALTRWLQGRYGIRDRDVIGHAESLSSPYHRERQRMLEASGDRVLRVTWGQAIGHERATVRRFTAAGAPRGES